MSPTRSRPALIPGEQLSLRLIKPGEQSSQGVGYLDDGTMVVAEDGRAYVGQQVTLMLTSTLQTSAGGCFSVGLWMGGKRRHRVELLTSKRGLRRTPDNRTGPRWNRRSNKRMSRQARDWRPYSAPVEPARPGPYPPKPPNKRVNPFRNRGDKRSHRSAGPAEKN